MAVAEFTLVGERIEVYVRIQTETKEVVDVYWSRKNTFPLDINDPDAGEVPHEAGKNPLFVHAVDPQQAFDLARKFYNVTSDEEDEFNALVN